MKKGHEDVAACECKISEEKIEKHMAPSIFGRLTR